MAKLSGPRDTQSAKDEREKRETEAIEQVLIDIRKRLRIADKANRNFDLLIAFNGMMNETIDESFCITHDPNLFPEFKILTHFYQSEEAKDEILTAFVDFFKNIMEAKAKKNDIIIRYENYLEAIELLKHAFYFSKYSTGEPFICDPFARDCDPSPEYDAFIKTATEYFAPFKEQKERYDLLKSIENELLKEGRKIW